MGRLYISKLPNKDIASRNILVHPPEPPMEVLCQDPTNSIYVGRTKMLNVPFLTSPIVLTFCPT